MIETIQKRDLGTPPAAVFPDAAVDFAGLDGQERETISDHGWFTPGELEATGEAADPTLPDVLRSGLAALGA